MAIRLSPGVYNPVDSVDISRLFFSGLKIPLVFPILYTRYEQVIHDKSTGYAHNENGAHWEGTNMKADQLQFAGIETVKTQCGCCGKVIELTEAVISTHIITPSLTETEHFCSDRCAEIEWRMRWCTTVSTARSTSQPTIGITAGITAGMNTCSVRPPATLCGWSRNERRPGMACPLPLLLLSWTEGEARYYLCGW